MVTLLILLPYLIAFTDHSRLPQIHSTFIQYLIAFTERCRLPASPPSACLQFQIHSTFIQYLIAFTERCRLPASPPSACLQFVIHSTFVLVSLLLSSRPASSFPRIYISNNWVISALFDLFFIRCGFISCQAGGVSGPQSLIFFRKF